MPLVSPTSVVSFSSEDPHHPASNLLNRDTYRKWKCKEEGEKEGFVILKFDKVVQITSIDIGNESSAMVEVHVARSGGDGNVKYEVLLSSSVLMSPIDSRALKNPCCVRSYAAHTFDRETAAQKWDLVKVAVSQIFNIHTQFGLTFIKFTAAPDPDAPSKIGMFSLRTPLGGITDEEEIEEEPLRIGSMFAKSLANKNRNSANAEQKNPTSAAIREVSQAIGTAAQSSNEEKVKELLNKNKLDSPAAAPTTIDSPTTTPSRSTTTDKLPSRNSLVDSPLRKKEKKSNREPNKNGNLTNRGDEPGGNSSEPETGTHVERRPFDKLFQGVVFVMSGFENPYRKNLRDQAVEMGAKCRKDWDSTCTHLIGAFINTPKFRQVRSAGNGKVVKKEWIERSYGARCRFPWRRFALDRNDKGQEESEEEIQEEVEEGHDAAVEEDQQSSSPPPPASIPAVDVNNKRRRDDEEEESLPKKRKQAKPLKENEEEEEEVADDEKKKLYDADTDVDDENHKPGDSSSDTDFEEEKAPSSKGIFASHVFYISSSADDNVERERIQEIISRRKGQLAETLTEEVEYLVTTGSGEWCETLSEAFSDNPNLCIVSKDWILKCESDNAITSTHPYIITPS